MTQTPAKVVAAVAAEGWAPVSGATSCAWTWTASCSCVTTGVWHHCCCSWQTNPQQASLALAAIPLGWHNALVTLMGLPSAVAQAI